MLKVENLSVHYGMIQAVKDVSFEVNKGEIVSLIGANGAGKTTILKSLSGLVKPSSGSMTFNNDDLTKKSAPAIVKSGLVQVPEGRHIFAGMTVMENLELGGFIHNNNDDKKEILEYIFETFPVLKERLKQDAATLSGGEQQMLAMGRALMTKPDLLLLDEPSMGLAPFFFREIFNIIERINKQGSTILLTEQNANMALKLSDIGYVLETGQVVLKGSGTELLESEEVQKAYLGG